MDLDYVPGSCVGPLRLDRVKEYTDGFASSNEIAPIELPAAYVDHLRVFHGGIPRRRRFGPRFVGRFLNYLKREDLKELKPSWRPGSIDERLDFSVARHGHESSGNWDRIHLLLPFAAIDTAGKDPLEMAEMDLLCFDYSAGPRPTIVTWNFHASLEDHVVKAEVAASFEDLLRILE